LTLLYWRQAGEAPQPQAAGFRLSDLAGVYLPKRVANRSLLGRLWSENFDHNKNVFYFNKLRRMTRLLLAKGHLLLAPP
jgi:hypothetical protein